MSSTGAPPPRPRRSRKSIATMPATAATSGVNKENTPAAPEPAAKTARKSRSKSLGPGGLDALRAAGEKARAGPLNDRNGNGRRASIAPAVKSILKPTLPLSPIQPIPAHRPRPQNAASEQPRKPVTARLNFDPSPPQPPAAPAQPTTIPVRSEEEQQRRAEITAIRDARRKSLGNRRVSFAPEATLHTWDVVEYYRGDDGSSTPSSSGGSGSSTSTPATSRRGSSGPFSGTPGMPATPTPAAGDRPGTPPDQVDHEPPSTPPSAREEHQKKNRHTVPTPPMMSFANPSGETPSSSPFSSSPEDEGDQSAFPVGDGAGSDSSDSLDDDSVDENERTLASVAADTTMGEGEMDIDIDDLTGAFKPFFKKPTAAWRFEGETAAIPSSPPVPAKRSAEEDSEGEDMTMEVTRVVGGVLKDTPGPKNAATGPQFEEEDDNDEMTMDMTRPLGGLIRTTNYFKTSTQFEEDITAQMDMTRPLGGILASSTNAIARAQQLLSENHEEADMTMDMDVTRAFGGILPTAEEIIKYPQLRQVDDEMEIDTEMDMDVTRPIGGILGRGPQTSTAPSTPFHAREDANENMTMEFTTVLGGLLDNRKLRGAEGGKPDEESDMDMTVAVGKIIPTGHAPSTLSLAKDSEDEDGDDQGATMDITRAVGKIMPEQSSPPEPASDVTKAPENIEAVEDPAPVAHERPIKPASRTFEEIAAEEEQKQNSPKISLLTPPKADEALTAASPTPVVGRRRSSSRRSSAASTGPVEKRVTRRSSAARKSLEGQVPSTSISQDETKADAKIPAPEAAPSVVVESAAATPLKKDTSTKFEAQSPPLPVTPSSKKQASVASQVSATPVAIGTPLKGVGIDRPGLGSPAVASKLGRRKSLSEDAAAFSPVGIPSVLVQTSREDAQREQEEERMEKLQREEEMKKMDLRSRINLLTPKKAGRKSIALGVPLGTKRALAGDASGGAAKRRRSLDGLPLVEEEDQEPDMLLTRSGRKLAKRAILPTPGSGRKKINFATPKADPIPAETPSKDLERKKVSIQDSAESALPEAQEPEPDSSFENISLKQFLEIIDIGFLDDLTTTKRRHTGFIGKKAADESEDVSLADCVAAGACTVPMLELFQHSCRELKKYIKEGRAVVKEIEKDTLAENPALFREYDYAPPDVKELMNTQFRDIKTHARLLAKGIWYEWRMKLLDGVKEGLDSNLAGLKADEELIRARQEAVGAVLPEMRKRYEELKTAVDAALKIQKRIEQDDPEQLSEARARLRAASSRIEAVRAELAQKQQAEEALNTEIKVKEQAKARLRESIEEAERIKEQNRGWSESEVRAWKAKTEALEHASGWRILQPSSNGRLELSFRREVKLTVGPGTAPLLEVIPVSEHSRQSQRSTMSAVLRDFFVATLSAQIAGTSDVRVVMRIIAEGWGKARALWNNIRRVQSHHPTDINANGTTMIIKSTVLVPELRSKMELAFSVGDSLEMVITGVRIVYGGISEEAVGKMAKEWTGGWKEGVDEIIGRCLEGRRRGGTMVALKAG